jgi:hypothetical protein
MVVLLILFILFIGLATIGTHQERKKQKAEQAHVASLVPVEREAYLAKKAVEKAALVKKSVERAERKQESRDTWMYGRINPQMICQHCGVRGSVRTQSITTKQGISGGKATAAILTGGVSLLATGLSRKVANTQAHCGNCRNDWYF